MSDTFFPLLALVFALSFFITVLSERKLIPFLSARAKQPIYADGPHWHLSKSGTPTMGGISFLMASSVAVLIATSVFMCNGREKSALSLFLTFLYAVLNGGVGMLDDVTKLQRKQNAGLSPKQKLICQFLLAGAYLFARAVFLGDQPILTFSFGTVNLGFFYYPLCLLVAVGTVNFANLTDGIDGLASSVAFGIGVGLFYLSFALSEETGVLASVLIGCALGFLCFNIHPAKIFMGDTGSLFFGSVAIGAMFTLKNPMMIVFFGAVYILEGLSVIIQVVWFKRTHKRVFLMAPLHHHFEKKGWSENRICLTALFATLLFSVPAFILSKS